MINGVEIQYVQFEKEVNRVFVEGILEQYSFLFPRYLRLLRITLYDDLEADGGPDAVCKANCKYGYAYIDIASKFLDRALSRQHHIIVHELVHIAHYQVLSFMRGRLINRVKESNPELADFLEEDSTERVEEFTEHMTGIIINSVG